MNGKPLGPGGRGFDESFLVNKRSARSTPSRSRMLSRLFMPGGDDA